MTAKEILSASRSDVFRVDKNISPEELEKLDLRLVQSFKRAGDTVEVKFVDIPKLCELALQEEAGERGAPQTSGLDALREIFRQSAEELRDSGSFKRMGSPQNDELLEDNEILDDRSDDTACQVV